MKITDLTATLWEPASLLARRLHIQTPGRLLPEMDYPAVSPLAQSIVLYDLSIDIA